MSALEPVGFRNAPVVLGDLPAVDQGPFERVDSKYLLQQRAMWLVFGTVAAIIASFAATVVPEVPRWFGAIAGGAALLVVIGAWVLEGQAFAYRGVLLRDHDVSFRRGLIGRRTVTVPFSRVQHVAVERGPLDRIFGLATVAVFTAGAGGADARIDGLAPYQADRLRATLVQRTETARAG